MSLKLVPRISGRVLGKLGWQLVRIRPTRRETTQARGAAHCAIEEVDDFRFRTSEWVYSVPVTQLVGRPIFNYGPQSWHPFVAASAELLKDIDIPYEQSVLRRFYDTFTPRTVADACGLDDPGPLASLPARSLFEPWRLFQPPLDDPHSHSYPPAATQLHGPLSRSRGEAELRRLRRAVKSILDYGYQPELFPRGRIRVTVLKCGRDQRYLVGHGQHRTAVLTALGHERVDVGIHSIDPLLVDEAEAHLWPHVRSGFLSVERAVAMLRRYFTPPSSDTALKIGSALRDEAPYETRVGP